MSKDQPPEIAELVEQSVVIDPGAALVTANYMISSGWMDERGKLTRGDQGAESLLGLPNALRIAGYDPNQARIVFTDAFSFAQEKLRLNRERNSATSHQTLGHRIINFILGVDND